MCPNSIYQVLRGSEFLIALRFTTMRALITKMFVHVSFPLLVRSSEQVSLTVVRFLCTL